MPEPFDNLSALNAQVASIVDSISQDSSSHVNAILQSTEINPSRSAYERLSTYIKEFENNLDDEHEIGARLVSFGSTVTFHIHDIGYYGPDIITFFGKNDEGQSVQLIQNVSQLSVLLIAVKKQREQPRRIGFMLDQK